MKGVNILHDDFLFASLLLSGIASHSIDPPRLLFATRRPETTYPLLLLLPPRVCVSVTTHQPTNTPRNETPTRPPTRTSRRVGNYSCLKVDLMFTRDRAFYFTTVFIPGIILVTSSFITFWLEWNAVPARVMIGELVRWPNGSQGETFHLPLPHVPCANFPLSRSIYLYHPPPMSVSLSVCVPHVHLYPR